MKTFLFQKYQQDKNDTIHIFQSTNRPYPPDHLTVASHLHDFIEIVYVVGGSATQTVNEDHYEVQRGDLLFINCGSVHSFEPHGAFTYINICFKPETLTESIITPENAFAILQLSAFEEIRRESEGSMISFSESERPEIEALLKNMLDEYTNRALSWRTVLESYMNLLIVRILRRVRFEATDKSDSDIWAKLSDYIDKNLGADLTLPTLAKKCFYNPSYFSRIFKERFDMSLTEYINHRRIETAIRLFRETDLSGEEIAERSGFSSKSSFYRVFTKITGRTPSEYRKKK